MKIIKEIISKIDNKEIYLFKIINDNNYSISFMNFGGYISEVLIPYKNNNEIFEDVILGYANPLDIIHDTTFFNVTAGRVCNRINNAEFTLNEKKYYLKKNHGLHHLHGGELGFNKKLWSIKDIKTNKEEVSVTMSYISFHLEENYPGNLKCETKYTFNNRNELIISYFTESDQDTIVNLTNHNYWNFHGHKDNYGNIENHQIEINSNLICELKKDLIPTGNFSSIENTKYDFNPKNNTKGKVIDKDLLNGGGIDINYIVNDKKEIKQVSKAWSNLTKMGVEYSTNQYGLQFYTGNSMYEKYNGKYNRNYGKNYGFCFEAQLFPDAINHKNFHSPILKVGEKYSSTTYIKLFNDFHN